MINKPRGIDKTFSDVREATGFIEAVRAAVQETVDYWRLAQSFESTTPDEFEMN
jgi:hypothetical protein